MILNIGSVDLDLQEPQVMGILNVTPDSFSDGGRFFDTNAAIRHAESMAAEGASIVDIGGESTRPGAASIPLQQELDRVIPVIESISNRIEVGISVDTSKPKVMLAAANAGAGMLNDVFALQADGAIDAVVQTDCAICLMHMQGVPHSMQEYPEYDDVATEVRSFLADRIAVCVDRGIDAARIVIDPGFGFGKLHRQNVELLSKLDTLQTLGRPILVGLSRKSTLGHLTGRSKEDRTAAGVAAAVLAYLGGACIVRTHDVAATVDALKVAVAVHRSEVAN